MKDHDLCNIFGIGSPLHKIYELDGYILLVGVGYDRCTSLHLSEATAEFPGKKTVEESSAILMEGKRKWVTYETMAVDDSDFTAIGEDLIDITRQRYAG